MTKRKLNQIIYARTEKIFELWSKGKITLEENMEMYIKMIAGYQRKYPIQMGEIFATPAGGSMPPRADRGCSVDVVV